MLKKIVKADSSQFYPLGATQYYICKKENRPYFKLSNQVGLDFINKYGQFVKDVQHSYDNEDNPLDVELIPPKSKFGDLTNEELDKYNNDKFNECSDNIKTSIASILISHNSMAHSGQNVYIPVLCDILKNIEKQTEILNKKYEKVNQTIQEIKDNPQDEKSILQNFYTSI